MGYLRSGLGVIVAEDVAAACLGRLRNPADRRFAAGAGRAAAPEEGAQGGREAGSARPVWPSAERRRSDPEARTRCSPAPRWALATSRRAAVRPSRPPRRPGAGAGLGAARGAVVVVGTGGYERARGGGGDVAPPAEDEPRGDAPRAEREERDGGDQRRRLALGPLRQGHGDARHRPARGGWGGGAAAPDWSVGSSRMPMGAALWVCPMPCPWPSPVQAADAVGAPGMGVPCDATASEASASALIMPEPRSVSVRREHGAQRLRQLLGRLEALLHVAVAGAGEPRVEARRDGARAATGRGWAGRRS